MATAWMPRAGWPSCSRQASILDFVAADAKRMSGRLGASDKQKLDEYLQAVRDIEKRIQKVEQGGTGAVALPAYSKPVRACRTRSKTMPI